MSIHRSALTQQHVFFLNNQNALFLYQCSVIFTWGLPLCCFFRYLGEFSNCNKFTNNIIWILSFCAFKGQSTRCKAYFLFVIVCWTNLYIYVICQSKMTKFVQQNVDINVYVFWLLYTIPLFKPSLVNML